MRSPSSRRAALRISRLAIDRLRWVYAALVLTQVVTILSYESGRLTKVVAVTAGLATSLAGPLLSLLVGIHTFQLRRSRAADVASVAASYAVTCVSFALIYLIISDFDPDAFTLPVRARVPMSLGTAIYFSVVTITTTGYGDISPASDLARAAACWEIITGVLYQVFVFSLAASQFSTPHAEHDDPD